jgi:hypothetical protein
MRQVKGITYRGIKMEFLQRVSVWLMKPEEL